jgi:CRP-like cAMP-binding protein
MKYYSDYLQPKHLRKLEIFSPLTETELQQFLDDPENGIEDYAPKEDIFHSTEIGECMYIILEGRVEVYLRGGIDVREINVANLHAGEYFGENVMISEKPVKRTASVRAYLPTLVFRMDKQCILAAIKGHTKISGRFPPDEVRDMIMSLPMFNSLNYEELLTIRDWTQVVTYKQNEFVFKASNPAEYMYVVLEGNIELLTLGGDGTIIVVSEYKKGDYFGEIGLMPDGKGKYGIYARASKESRVIKIPKEYFRLLLSRDSKLADKLNTIHQIKKLRIKQLQNQ